MAHGPKSKKRRARNAERAKQAAQAIGYEGIYHFSVSGPPWFPGERRALAAYLKHIGYRVKGCTT